MPAKHFNLGIDPRRFGAWLELWEFNRRSYLKPEEAQEMSQMAHKIGWRLRNIISSEETGRISQGTVVTRIWPTQVD